MRAKPPRLAVLLSGKHVANLDRRPNGALRLAYTANSPLSLSLPAEIETHTGGNVSIWLDALLPDNSDVLAGVERQYGADRRDTMSLLEVIGKDCAGAVQFCRPDEIDDTINRHGELIPATSADIEQRLSMMAIDATASWAMPDEHWSLGGTQPKFTLRNRDGKWFYATGSEPSTHIVKPGVRGLAAQALSEHASMATAARMGLLAAETSYRSFGSEDALVITRFDRSTDKDLIVRLHQEDVCQALGAKQKYQEYGGPSAADIIGLLRGQSDTAGMARSNVDRFVDGFIFNTVIGAPDAHGRNYAIMLGEHGPQLAPLFDVASGLGYDMPTGSGRVLSMSVGGTYLLDEIKADAWKLFAEQGGLDERVVLERVQQMAETIADEMDSVLDECSELEAARALRERLIPVLRTHAETVARSTAASLQR